MGTPDFAVASLQAILEAGYNVVAVVTQPDKPVGRHGSVLQPPAVKQYAQSKGLPVLQPEKMKDPGFIEQLHSYHANLQVVVAFRMLPELVWNMPELGTFNVHAALLPQYRGAAPINWAVINGETVTGVTTFFLDQQIDTGRVILQRQLPISDEANVGQVYDQQMTLGAQACIETLDLIVSANGHPDSIEQEQMATGDAELHTAPKLFKETCQIDWHMPAKKVYDFIRGLSPVPGAWTQDTDGHIYKMYATAKTNLNSTQAPGTLIAGRKNLYVCCADMMLEIKELQPAGKKRMEAAAFLNGSRNTIEGLHLDSPSHNTTD